MGSFIERKQFPQCIVTDAGMAFAMGAMGGSAFHFIKSFRHAPSGARIAYGLEAVRMNAPRIGGSFAVWGGLFSACNCAMVYLRQKEDPWTSIVSGAAVGGLLSVRQGFPAVVRSSFQGALLLALVSGTGLMAQSPQPTTILKPVNDPAIASVETSSGDGLFGKKEGGRGNHK